MITTVVVKCCSKETEALQEAELAPGAAPLTLFFMCILKLLAGKAKYKFEDH